MTREEMWEEFENQLKREVHTPMTMNYDESVRLVELGIKEIVTRWKERLEQEPCEDCISRKAALSDDGLSEFHYYEDYVKMRNYLKSLPSVNPQELKTEQGRWICPSCKTTMIKYPYPIMEEERKVRNKNDKRKGNNKPYKRIP